MIGVSPASLFDNNAAAQLRPSNTAASAPGIIEGDIIRAIDGQYLRPSSFEQVQQIVQNSIRQFPEQSLDFLLLRDGSELHLKVTPDMGLNGQGVVGLALIQNPLPDITMPANGIQALAMGGAKFGADVSSFSATVQNLFANLGNSSSLEAIKGPLAIINTGAESSKYGVRGVL